MVTPPTNMREQDELFMKLVGPLVKIKRAEKHIFDLNDTLTRRIYERPLYSLNPYVDPQTGSNFIHVNLKIAPQLATAMLLGDALHNLRSALDLGWVMALKQKAPSAIREQTKFPIFKTWQDLKGGINGVLNNAPAAASLVDFILDVVNPDETANPILVGLNRLNIMDKHQVLIPSLQLTAIRDVVVENDKGARMKHTIIGLETNNLVRIPLAGKLTVKDQGKASVSVFFGNGLPFDGDSVVPALVRITEEVTRTLKELYILMDWKEAVEVFNGWKLG